MNKKSYRPTPLYATRILRWPDRSAQDQQDTASDDEASKGPVVILSTAESGLFRYDQYDARSLIENRLNREGKRR